jgi:hypothetical protein
MRPTESSFSPASSWAAAMILRSSAKLGIWTGVLLEDVDISSDLRRRSAFGNRALQGLGGPLVQALALGLRSHQRAAVHFRRHAQQQPA